MLHSFLNKGKTPQPQLLSLCTFFNPSFICYIFKTNFRNQGPATEFQVCVKSNILFARPRNHSYPLLVQLSTLIFKALLKHYSVPHLIRCCPVCSLNHYLCWNPYSAWHLGIKTVHACPWVLDSTWACLDQVCSLIYLATFFFLPTMMPAIIWGQGQKTWALSQL